MDSPRGRIDLMKGLAEGAITLDATVVGHFDACLGCMACVPACPSGVRYDLLIESTRATVERDYERSLADRAYRGLVFALFPYPSRLRALAWPLVAYAKSGLQSLVRRLGLMRLLPRRLAQLDALTPPLEFADLRASLPAFTPARGSRRGCVALLAGCVQRVFFPNVNAATIRVLAAEGFDVVVPRTQGCCGALSLHAGRAEEAKRFGRALIAAFDAAGEIDHVVVNAAGCGSSLKQYGDVFADDPEWGPRAAAFADKIRDVNEFLASVEPVARRSAVNAKIAYHDACHLAHAQRVRDQPRALLRAIPGVELLEIPDGGQCCGSAGVYNLIEPESSEEIGERKVENVLSVGADVLASANPGCTLQISALLAKRGVRLRTAHPIEILDASLRGYGVIGGRGGSDVGGGGGS
jgi:glycolate oxidase iron-sulfur subunit